MHCESSKPGLVGIIPVTDTPCRISSQDGYYEIARYRFAANGAYLVLPIYPPYVIANVVARTHQVPCPPALQAPSNGYTATTL